MQNIISLTAMGFKISSENGVHFAPALIMCKTVWLQHIVNMGGVSLLQPCRIFGCPKIISSTYKAEQACFVEKAASFV